MTDKHLGKLILNQIRKKDKTYSSWMKRFLSPKEFYALRNTAIISLSIEKFLLEIKNILSEDIFNLTTIEVEMLLQKFNRYGLTINIYRSYFSNSQKKKIKSLNKIKLTIFYLRIKNSLNLSIKKEIKNENFDLESINLKFIAPVCPDYSNIEEVSGKYKYTFESLGTDIGVVAKKALFNIRQIKKLALDLINEFFKIEYHIYVGDFECSEKNCKLLNETRDSFLEKTKVSALKIQESEKNINCDVFTKLTGGIKTWRYLIKFIKDNQKINSFYDLKIKYPFVHHEKAIISRIPLYRRWYGDNAQIKEIFFEQVIEYMAMGLIISTHFGKNAFILASDHKVMRSYYNLTCSNPLIGASANY
tara:strand:+ start:310 stop:1392 length:1083 start_codon:yes stop_codon:yes gene_type:complete